MKGLYSKELIFCRSTDGKEDGRENWKENTSLVQPKPLRANLELPSKISPAATFKMDVQVPLWGKKNLKHFQKCSTQVRPVIVLTEDRCSKFYTK